MSKNMARFEQLAYLGLILSAVEAPVEIMRASTETQASSASASSITVVAIVSEALGIGVAWLLIWLVARRGKLGARWLFLAVYLAALGFFVVNFGRSAPMFDWMNALQALVWGAALCFMFLPDGRSPSPPAPLPAAHKPRSPAKLRVPAGRRQV